MNSNQKIGLLHESSLHASLKIWYGQSGDVFESRVDGYWIDIQRGNQLIEIQTGNFSRIKAKLVHLLDKYPVQIIYPVARLKWITKFDPDGNILSKRRSPRHGSTFDIFSELVKIPHLILHPNLTIEVLLIEEEEIRTWSSTGPWRKRGWTTVDRKLIQVLDKHIFSGIEDYCILLAKVNTQSFDSKDLCTALQIPRPLGIKILYCLKKNDVIKQIGKKGRSNLYTSACLG